MLRWLSIFFLTVTALWQASASVVLRGRVTDYSGEPLEGVTVSLGTGRGATLTDAKGMYRLTTADTDTLRASFRLLGYREERRTLLHPQGEQCALVTLLESDDETERGYRIMEEPEMDFPKGRTKVYSVIRIFPDESGRFCVAYDRVHKDGETIRLWGEPVCPRGGNAGIDTAIEVQIQEGQEIEILVRKDRLASLTEDRS